MGRGRWRSVKVLGTSFRHHQGVVVYVLFYYDICWKLPPIAKNNGWKPVHYVRSARFLCEKTKYHVRVFEHPKQKLPRYHTIVGRYRMYGTLLYEQYDSNSSITIIFLSGGLAMIPIQNPSTFVSALEWIAQHQRGDTTSNMYGAHGGGIYAWADCWK